MNTVLLETSRALCQGYGDSVAHTMSKVTQQYVAFLLSKSPLPWSFPHLLEYLQLVTKQLLECSITAQWQRPLWCSLQRHGAGARRPAYNRHLLGRCAGQSMTNSSPLEVPVPIISSTWNPVLADMCRFFPTVIAPSLSWYLP